MISIKIFEKRYTWVIVWLYGNVSNETAQTVNIKIVNTFSDTPLNSSYCVQSGLDDEDTNNEASSEGAGVKRQIYILKKRDLRVLSDLLCDKLFNGDEPTLVDVIMFSAFFLRTYVHNAVPNSLMEGTDFNRFPELSFLIRNYGFYDWNDIYATLDVTGNFVNPPQRIRMLSLATDSDEEQLADEEEKAKADEKEFVKNVLEEFINQPELNGTANEDSDDEN